VNKEKSTGVHSTAQAYQKVSQTYERGRPEYTPTSVELLISRLGVEIESKVLDLGAGTGKFTKHLLKHCSDIVAVEPVSSMREELAKNLAGIAVLAGNDESVDAVIVANAFHWFDGPKALVVSRNLQ
jgi:ubiquinone/menaquinone biosynthesis C-methylase UbiE